MEYWVEALVGCVDEEIGDIEQESDIVLFAEFPEEVCAIVGLVGIAKHLGDVFQDEGCL